MPLFGHGLYFFARFYLAFHVLFGVEQVRNFDFAGRFVLFGCFGEENAVDLVDLVVHSPAGVRVNVVDDLVREQIDRLAGFNHPVKFVAHVLRIDLLMVEPAFGFAALLPDFLPLAFFHGHLALCLVVFRSSIRVLGCQG